MLSFKNSSAILIETKRNEKEWTLIKFYFLADNKTYDFDFLKICEEEDYKVRISLNILIISLILLCTFITLKFNFNYEVLFRKLRNIRFTILNLIIFLIINISFPKLYKIFEKFFMICYNEYVVGFLFSLNKILKTYFPNSVRNFLRRKKHIRSKIIFTYDSYDKFGFYLPLEHNII